VRAPVAQPSRGNEDASVSSRKERHGNPAAATCVAPLSSSEIYRGIVTTMQSTETAAKLNSLESTSCPA